TCAGLRNATSSQASLAGPSHSLSLVIRPPNPSGLEAAHANLSARQARKLGLMTSGTCGRPSTGSSSSAALQSSLVSKLQARLQPLGPTLSSLTWKPWVTPAQRSLSRLRASVRRTSATGRIGWPTPTTRDWKDGVECANVPINSLLGRSVWMAGWQTPTANETTHCYGQGRTVLPRLMGEAELADHSYRQGNSAFSRYKNNLPKTIGPARLTVSGIMLIGSPAG